MPPVAKLRRLHLLAPSSTPFERLRRVARVACLLTLSVAGACTSGPGAGNKWTSYPSLASPGGTRTYKWLVVKCRLSDVPKIPSGLDTAINQFLGPSGAGYGNLQDYFHDVSYNHASVVGDVSVPWVTAPFGSKNLPGRQARVEQCLSAIPADQLPDLDEFWGVVVVNNVVQDGGACSIGQTGLNVNGASHKLACVWFDPDSLKTEFAAQEIAHGLGLDHSFEDSGRNCGGNPGEYCDPWDIMSAQNTYQFTDANWVTAGAASGGGPGMNAPNLLRMGWLNASNQRRFFSDGDEQTFKLRALSRPRGDEPLVVIVQTDDPRQFEGIYTVEYRQGDGWDRGFSSDLSTPEKVRTSGGVVLVHQYRPVGSPSSTLIDGAFSGALQSCDTIVLGNGARYVHVSSIDTADGSATVTVGAGRGKHTPCFRNILTHRLETSAAGHLVGGADTVGESDGPPSSTRPLRPVLHRHPMVRSPWSSSSGDALAGVAPFRFAIPVRGSTRPRFSSRGACWSLDQSASPGRSRSAMFVAVMSSTRFSRPFSSANTSARDSVSVRPAFTTRARATMASPVPGASRLTLNSVVSTASPGAMSDSAE